MDKEGEPDIDGMKQDFREMMIEKSYIKKFKPIKQAMKPKIKDEWDMKYWRESWTFPFGSILNSFAIANQGKGISPEKYLEFVDAAYQKAQELIDKSMLKVEENEPKEKFINLQPNLQPNKDDFLEQ